MYDPILGRWLEQDPIGFNAGDMDLYRIEGNSPTDRLDPNGLQSIYGYRDNTKGARAAIDEKVDKLSWPNEKKTRIKEHLYRLIDTAQFAWYHNNGLFGYCNEWVDEIYPKIKGLLPAANKDGILVYHYGWETWSFGGHEAIRVSVSDAPGNNNSFTFYLDDGWVGGEDHFFGSEEVKARWTEHLKLLMTGQNETLEDLQLKRPIGPGYPGYLPCPMVAPK